MNGAVSSLPVCTLMTLVGIALFYIVRLGFLKGRVVIIVHMLKSGNFLLTFYHARTYRQIDGHNLDTACSSLVQNSSYQQTVAQNWLSERRSISGVMHVLVI
jgi:hypothetical protein